jgi:hypothetical protein
MKTIITKSVSLLFAILLLVTSGTARGDTIRQIDFKNFAYPWDTPSEFDNTTTWRWNDISNKTTRLSDGLHRFIDPEAPAMSPALRFHSVSYGHLTGVGSEVAAVVLNYTTGGTMNWNYLYLYTSDKSRPKLLGLLRSGSGAAGGLINTSFQEGLLVLDFADFDKRMGDCCSSGYIRVRYRWADGRFVEEGARQKGDLPPENSD